MELKSIPIGDKMYVPVHERIRYFNETYPNGVIATEILTPLDSKQIVIKAVVVPDMAKPERRFNGHSQEVVGDSFINKTSAIENAETSAVGRALGMMGIGVDTGLASADEVVKAQKAATAPDVMTMPTDVAKHFEEQRVGNGECGYCGAPMSDKPSKTSGKLWCTAKCWLPENKHLQTEHQIANTLAGVEEEADGDIPF